MDSLKDLLPTRLFEVLEKSGICTTKQIIILSLWDIKKLTNLLNDDIKLVKNIVSNNCSPVAISGDLLEDKNAFVKSGCASVDKILNGGFRVGTLTEIYGESGAGKTQIALQTAVYCGSSGCVFICTEDLFPVKRFNQISQYVWHDIKNIECKKNIFIEHLTEAHELLSCIRVRLPKLLKLNNISAVILDSVAAPFRSENTNYVQRAEELKELAILLLNIAQEYNLAVICINQVTACFTGSNDVLPTLGLVWSNLICCRLKLTKKTSEYRELTIAFAPHLSNEQGAQFIITKNGIEDKENILINK
ncbi:DNA repair protein XRCC3 [Nymphalis io]|uniref:DNA repair protein XRCC3 n=1 Tax=Inachis io TaxID=171585 RepID=UPI002168E71A|nr:DNA repair protein XRCC3 [Nymphalis io]